MVELAVADNPGFRVDAREVRRAGPSYTVDTLRELKGAGCGDLLLVLGSDAIADLPNWREPGEIRRLARVVVANKEPATRIEGYESVDMPLLRISSSEIRQRAAEGKPIRYLVPERVADFISTEGLYRRSVAR